MRPLLRLAPLALVAAMGCIYTPVELAPLPDPEGPPAARTETLRTEPDATAVRSALDGLVASHVAGARRQLRTAEVEAKLVGRRQTVNGGVWFDLGLAVGVLAANGFARNGQWERDLFIPFTFGLDVWSRQRFAARLDARIARCQEVARDGNVAIDAYAADARARFSTVPPPGPERDRVVGALVASRQALADSVTSLMARCS